MNKQRLLTALGAAAAMLVLILDSRTALEGAREGIALCIKTLIPSLFPFFVVSALLTGTLVGQPLNILKPLCTRCGIPSGAESLLAVGLLGGYPVGAQNVALAYRSGYISKTDSERLLAFCNNAGPSFLFGILGPMFSGSLPSWILWAIHIISSLLVGAILAGKSSASVSPKTRPVSLTQAPEGAVRTMAVVSGWVVIFRMILTFLERWILWTCPETVQIAIASILELSNGCIQLAQLDKEGLRFLLAAVFLSLGGLCVTMQTISVTKGLSLRLYFPGKALQAAISFLLSVPAQNLFPVSERIRIPAGIFILALVICVFSAVILVKKKNTSSIPAPVGV